MIICQLSCRSQVECPEGINVIPMYGEVTKCEQQIRLDKEFISESEQQFKSKKIAAEYYVSKGWEYFYKNDDNTAMKRFNQAWLLDDSNPEIYWGFGNLLGRKNKFEESLKYLKKSITINSNNTKVYECMAISYGQLFYQTKDSLYLKLRIESLQKAIKLEPKNGTALGELATTYAFTKQKDSLLHYIKKADAVDLKIINPEIKKLIKNK